MRCGCQGWPEATRRGLAVTPTPGARLLFVSEAGLGVSSCFVVGIGEEGPCSPGSGPVPEGGRGVRLPVIHSLWGHGVLRP